MKQQAHLKVKPKEAILQQGVMLDDDMTTLTCVLWWKKSNKTCRKSPSSGYFGINSDKQHWCETCIEWDGMIKFWLHIYVYPPWIKQGLWNTKAIRMNISLPQRTLRDYSNAVKAVLGFFDDVDHQLKEAVWVSTSKEWEKLVVLLLDEVYTKEDLVYMKHERVLVGFVDLGSVNNHLLTFEPSIDTDTNESIAFAKSVMTFMESWWDSWI